MPSSAYLCIATNMKHITHNIFGFVLCAFFVFKNVLYCDGQFSPYNYYESNNFEDFTIGNFIANSDFFRTTMYGNTPPVPFPTCRADNIDCLRRGLRTFFILMDSSHLGMKPVDPIIINSVAISLLDQQTTFLLRRVNVTGARWSRLLERKIDIEERRNTAIFSSDLHITGELFMSIGGRLEPYAAPLTMDIYGAESNVSYAWRVEQGIDNEDYILIGRERITVRNTKIPSFFLQPNSEDANILEQALTSRPSVLDHLSNEIVTSLLHSIIDNFRLFTNLVPVKYYYKYY